jgi:hypothetical protein
MRNGAAVHGHFAGRARNATLIAFLVAVIVGVALPARAADVKITGSILVGTPSSDYRLAVDWPVFAAQSCSDVKDGVQEAVLNGTSFNGKTITVKATGAQQGGASAQKILVALVFYSCTDVATTLNPPQAAVIGYAYPGHNVVKTISASLGVKEVVLENWGGATGLTYTFCAKAVATATC